MESSKHDWTLSGTATSLKSLFLVPKVSNSKMASKTVIRPIKLWFHGESNTREKYDKCVTCACISSLANNTNRRVVNVVVDSANIITPM